MHLGGHLPHAICLVYLYLIRPTSAGCKNFTYILDLEDEGQIFDLDSLACLSGNPHLPSKPDLPDGYCQFPSRIYNFTVPPRLSASLTPRWNFTRNCPSCSNLLQLSPDCLSICYSYSNFASNEPDNEDQAAIFALAQDAWKQHYSYSYLVKPLTAIVSFNSSTGQEDLILAPGNNYTLEFLPTMAYVVGIVDGCANKTMNGLAVKVGTYGWQTSSGLSQTQGVFTMDQKKLPASNSSASNTQPPKNMAGDGGRSISHVLVWTVGILELMCILGSGSL